MFKKLLCGAALGAMLFTGAPMADAAVGYLAPAGTFSEEAARIYFGAEEEYIAVPSVGEAIDLVENDKCEFAVVPIENTKGYLAGKGKDIYVDLVVKHPNLSIIGEVNLPIRQTLMGMPGAKLEDLKLIYSHPQGIKQGKAWLDEHCPNAKCEEVASTAGGAKKVSELKDPTVAAIAGPAAAPLYGLEVLGTNIQIIKTNVTRFYVVTKKAPVIAKNDRAVIVAKGNAAELPAVLQAVTKAGGKLISVHDRTTGKDLGDYGFVVEVANANPAALAKLPAQFAKKMEISVRGTFNEITPQD